MLAVTPTLHGPTPADLERELLVVGLARDCARTLEHSVQVLAAALPGFQRVRWFVVESDSRDDTVAVLQRMAASRPGFEFRSLGQLEPRIPGYTERLAHCRNACLDYLRADLDLARIAYVAVADLDGINDGLTAAAVGSCWMRDDWSVCTANADGPYYDLWALRHPRWCPGDCWAESEFIGRHSGNTDSARRAAVYARMIQIPPTADWMEVDSAFGGLAIYRTEALLTARYAGLGADGAACCEHVPLNLHIRAQGGRIFINPELLNAPAAELRQYWPGREVVARKIDSLLFRTLLRLVYGKRDAKELRRMIRTVL